LLETPSWLGLTFDDVVDVSENPDGVAVAEQARGWPEVDAVSHLLLFLPPLGLGPDRETALVIAFSTGPDAVQPAVIDGRAPESAGEVLLSPKLADDLDADVGDRLDATFDNSEFAGEEQSETEPFRLEVVGVGPVPIGDGRTIHGAAMTYEGALARLPAEMTAEFEEAPRTNVILVDRADGVTADVIAERFAREGIAVEEGAIDRETIAANIVSVDPTSTESAPNLLAALMALLAGGLIVYGLSVTVGRNSRDLAVVRALGFTPRLLRRTARWAALAFALAALTVGIPIGLVAGRAIWRVYAENLGVIPDPVVDPWEIVVFGLSTLVLALLVGTAAAHRQARTRPGTFLRSE
jgi:putative ABC transport system permease protein